MNIPRFYIFTGGPGSGKTTLLHALEAQGYTVMPEVGRAIIQREQALGSDVLPWENKQLFYEAMLSQSVYVYEHCITDEVILWDRGILDSIGYAVLEGLDISEAQHSIASSLQYMPTVFILPPWEEIYTQDKERKQDMEIAMATYETMKTMYQRYGYTLIEVPKGTVDERVTFVMNQLKKEENERNNRD
ncbi:AAA family ATPase [Myroides odoratimimus]|uniref:AAA family ATPase n=1 Tax=Myroides odoratimimus TaxID=76832 RepID=UPI0025762B3D|nr:AAA family ATPase [Myroides odoratimimus]MDM1396854.1 AAA family ATPase [Myroides odoratimimus]